jgi:hypothetical protein
MRRHGRQRALALAPQQCGCEMDRVQRAEWRRQWFAGATQDRWSQQHEVECFEPIAHCSRSGRCLLEGESPLQSQTIDRPGAFEGDQLAGHQSVAGLKVLECAGLSQDEAKQYGCIDVRDHRRCRSSSRMARLSVGAAGAGGSERSPGRRVARRTSIVSAAYGIIRATGVSRSRTVNVRPFRTDRKCSLRRDLSSAIRTVPMTPLWSQLVTRGQVSEPLHLARDHHCTVRRLAYAPCPPLRPQPLHRAHRDYGPRLVPAGGFSVH